ncbi:MAG: tetratricopeptide repeat protein [Allosphingosinicella sp.]
MTPILLALAAFQTQAAAPAAQAPAPAAPVADRYGECIALIRGDPQRAVQTAEAWRLGGGGIDAQQCLGLAHVELGSWATAANVYADAARAAEATGDPRRADLWVQAGNAWIAAGEANRALEALDSALATPNLTDELRGEVHIDRARALAGQGNVAGARTDLDRALQLVPADPFAWYLSAALAHRANDLVRARADIEQAVQRAPDNPDIVLLAGTLAGLSGDMEEAERLYRRVAEGAPDSEAGRAARESLATLREVEVSAPAGTPAQAPVTPQPTTPQVTTPPPQLR